MKKLNLSLVVLSLFIFISSLILANAIKNASVYVDTHFPNHMDIGNMEQGYELIVDGGWLYLYDKESGQIFKKPDNEDPEAKWITVRHFSED